MVLQSKPPTNKNIKKRPANRSAQGSGLIEGTVGLMMITGATLVAVLLVINAGVASYSKEKLGFVATQAAYFAVTPYNRNVDPNTRSANVTSFVKNMLDQMGTSASNLNVQVTDTATGGLASITVTVSATLQTIATTGFSSVLPQQINISDTGMAIKSPYTRGYCVGAAPIGGSVLLSLINATGQKPPPINIPIYAIDDIVGLSGPLGR